MKTIKTLILIFLIHHGTLRSQSNNLLDGDYQVSGYGGFSTAYFFDQPSGLFTGGHGAMLINNRLSLGGGGMGGTLSLNGQDYTVGYGGPAFGYTLAHEKAVHPVVYLGSYFGGGSAENLNTSEFSFFSLQPKIAAELNLTDFLRLQVGAGYNWFWYFEDSDVQPTLNSPSLFIRMNFGWFGAN